MSGSTTAAAGIEIGLQRMLTVYIVTGLLFLLLPGTFLGVWNLVSIGGRHSLAGLSPAWVQAHGHAQLFGWLGTFILGIGYYSLSKMGGLTPVAAGRAWMTWALWTSGVTLRWTANVTGSGWRVLLPLSAVLQLAGFVVFFATVSRHKPRPGGGPRPPRPMWMKLVMASTAAFFVALIANLGIALALSTAAGPEIPHWLDQRYLFLVAWGFPVLAVWGFNARWLPVFLGLPEPSAMGLRIALAAATAALAAALPGYFQAAALLLTAASLSAALALRIVRRPVQPAKVKGVSKTFPAFVRGAYVWLVVASVLGVYASFADSHGGIWGASRHALTVGFLATMVFAIGQRVLPAFCGMRLLYSKGLMLASLAVLNAGCALRVASEIPAYEWNLPLAWKLLPVSAFAELAAVTLFAVNLAASVLLPKPAAAVAPPQSGPELGGLVDPRPAR